MIWLALLIADIGAPGMQTVPPAVPATPATEPRSWVRDDDYPVAAVRARRTGSVGFTLQVDATGSVTECAVDVSSGSDDLDIATCNLMRSRATFKPARDAKGKPVAWHWSSKFRWELPATSTVDLAELPSSSGYEIVVTLDEASKITACEVIRNMGSGSEKVCDAIRAAADRQPTRVLVAGKGVRMKMHVTSIVTYEPLDEK